MSNNAGFSIFSLIPLLATSGGGGGKIEVDNKTIDKNASEQIEVKEDGLEVKHIKTTAISKSTNDVRNYENSSDEKLTSEKFLQKTLQNIQDPMNNNDATNKQYVDKEIKKVIDSTFTFQGFITTTEPTTNLKTGMLWFNADTLPTTFPISVKVYDGTNWSTNTQEYTPAQFDTWSLVSNNHGYYWFGNNWNILDTSTSTTDNISIDRNNQNELEVKNGGITKDKLNADVVDNTTIELNTTDGIRIKDIITANNTDGLKSFTLNAKGQVNNYTMKVLGRGVSDVNTEIGHSNSITAQTTQKIGIVSFDSEGHITGFTETPIQTNVDENSTNYQLVGAKCFYDNSLIFEYYNIADVLDLVNSNFTINNTTLYEAQCILKKNKSEGILFLNFYADTSTTQTTAGWKRISLLKSTFPYRVKKIGTSEIQTAARNLGSIWDGSGYANLAISVYANGDIQSYYYQTILNKNGGLNICLCFPITKK